LTGAFMIFFFFFFLQLKFNVLQGLLFCYTNNVSYRSSVFVTCDRKVQS